MGGNQNLYKRELREAEEEITRLKAELEEEGQRLGDVCEQNDAMESDMHSAWEERDSLRAANAKLEGELTQCKSTMKKIIHPDGEKNFVGLWVEENQENDKLRATIQEQAGEIERLRSEYNARLSGGSRSEVAYMNEIDEQANELERLREVEALFQWAETHYVSLHCNYCTPDTWSVFRFDADFSELPPHHGETIVEAIRKSRAALAAPENEGGE